MRYMLTDELWASMEPLVEAAKQHKGGQPPTLPDRDFFEALLYLARTGVPWRDLPAEFGRWDAVYNRFRRGVRAGGLKAVFEGMTADPAFGDTRRVLIDSTIVRAHQHAAGARRKKKSWGPTGRRGIRRWAAAAAGSARRSWSPSPTRTRPWPSMSSPGRRATPRSWSRCSTGPWTGCRSSTRWSGTRRSTGTPSGPSASSGT